MLLPPPPISSLGSKSQGTCFCQWLLVFLYTGDPGLGVATGLRAMVTGCGLMGDVLTA